MHRQFVSLFAASVFAASAIGQCLSVTTLTTSGNGQSGAMFDVVNITAAPITIGSFDQCFFSAGTAAQMQIYTKVGTWNGSQTTPGAWTLVGSTTNFVHGLAPTLDALPIPVNVTIGGGQTQAFYITGDAATTIAYTTGVNQLGTVIGSDPNLQVLGGIGVAFSFAGNFGLPTAGRLWNGRVNYCPAGSGTVLATNTTTGAGCITVADASSYENFATAAAFDLGNSAITLLRTPTGYTAVPGVTTYQAPSGTAQVLALTDDSEASVTLSQAMPFSSTSSTNTLTVCSNGFISSGSGNGTAFTPAPAAFLAGPRAWWSVRWHDYNPSIAGSGQVKFEQIGTVAYVTWDGVWDFGGATAANANTFQAQFDVVTGTVHFVYQTLSGLGNGCLVGYSDPGASADPGSIDISALLPATFPAAVFAVAPLTLTAATRPIIGTNWNLSVSNVPPTTALGVDIFGLSDPAIADLGFLGMPTCGLRASLDLLNAWLPAGNTHAYSFAVPNNPAILNVHLFTTSAAFQNPPVNAFGAITSNGIDGRIGDF
jgi:hypothetical protein